MMISTNTYIDNLKNKNYKELIKERNKLVKEIEQFEKGELEKKFLIIDPSPEVVYQCNLQYLSSLCTYMCEKYNLEVIRGENND